MAFGSTFEPHLGRATAFGSAFGSNAGTTLITGFAFEPHAGKVTAFGSELEPQAGSRRTFGCGSKLHVENPMAFGLACDLRRESSQTVRGADVIAGSGTAARSSELRAEKGPRASAQGLVVWCLEFSRQSILRSWTGNVFGPERKRAYV